MDSQSKGDSTVVAGLGAMTGYGNGAVDGQLVLLTVLCNVEDIWRELQAESMDTSSWTGPSWMVVGHFLKKWFYLDSSIETLTLLCHRSCVGVVAPERRNTARKLG